MIVGRLQRHITVCDGELGEERARRPADLTLDPVRHRAGQDGADLAVLRDPNAASRGCAGLRHVHVPVAPSGLLGSCGIVYRARCYRAFCPRSWRSIVNAAASAGSTMVNLKSEGVPVANSRSPRPRTVGKVISRYSSTRSAVASVHQAQAADHDDVAARPLVPDPGHRVAADRRRVRPGGRVDAGAGGDALRHGVVWVRRPAGMAENNGESICSLPSWGRDRGISANHLPAE